MPLSDTTVQRFARIRAAMKDDPESLRDLNAILTEISSYRTKLEITANELGHFLPKRY